MSYRIRARFSDVTLRAVAALGLIAGTTVGGAQSVLAADAKPALSVTVEPPGAARPGEHLVVEVASVIPAGYHLYAMTRIAGGPKPLAINVVSDPGLIPVGGWFATETPVVAFDARFGKSVEKFAGQVAHRRVFAVPAASPVGPRALSVAVTGQICDEHQCIVFRETLPATVTVAAGPTRADRAQAPTLTGVAFFSDSAATPSLAAPASPAAPPVATDTSVRAVSSGGGASSSSSPSSTSTSGAPPLGTGLWSFLLLAFLAGLGALSTPCVFPMIPITVSFFSKYSKVSVRQSAAMAAIYATSIIFCFTIIGVAVSVLFGAVGMQSLSASAGFNIFLFVLLAVFSFNLFGLFEINVPSGIIARTSAKERELTGSSRSFGSHAVGVFLMAVTFTLVSFTCTVGFVGVVLAQAAKGNWFFPAIGMLVFSFAFSIPFFGLAMFPSWAHKLRGKSGDWMVAIKVILGFFELAGSLKFLSNVDLLWHWGIVTRPMVLALWGAIFLTGGLYLLRIFNLPSIDDKTKNVGPIRMMFAVVMFSLSMYAAAGIRDTRSMGGWLDGWLPPAVYPGDESATSASGPHAEAADDFSWIKDDLDRAASAGRAAGQPVFVDFTGYTCTNCRYMEGAVFPRPEVRSRLRKMVLAQSFTDCDEPVCERQRSYQVARFDTAALPFYAILDPRNDGVLATFASSTNDVGEFTRFLQSGLDAYARAGTGTNTAVGDGKGTGAVVSAAQPTPVLGASDVVVAPAGAPRVDFSFPRLAGGATPWRLSQLRGHWTLVNFWASWCAPCLKELRDDFPVALAQAPWVKLVTVAFEGTDTMPAALTFARQNQLLTRSVALAGTESVTAANLDAGFAPDDSLPATYLIGPDGHVGWRHHGSIDARLLARVLAQTQHAR